MAELNELQTEWLKALRSGKYKQGVGRLRKDDKFCCLGVLCDVVNPHLWTENLYAVNPTFGPDESGYNAFPPRNILLDAGIAGIADSLIRLNDDKNLPFEEIARRLEAFWKHESSGVE